MTQLVKPGRYIVGEAPTLSGGEASATFEPGDVAIVVEAQIPDADGDVHVTPEGGAEWEWTYLAAACLTPEEA